MFVIKTVVEVVPCGQLFYLYAYTVFVQSLLLRERPPPRRGIRKFTQHKNLNILRMNRAAVCRCMERAHG